MQTNVLKSHVTVNESKACMRHLQWSLAKGNWWDVIGYRNLSFIATIVLKSIGLPMCKRTYKSIGSITTSGTRRHPEYYD